MKRTLILAVVTGIVILLLALRRDTGLKVAPDQPDPISLTQAVKSAVAGVPAGTSPFRGNPNRVTRQHGMPLEVSNKLAALKGTARDQYLRQISTNSPELQAWGKEKILTEANRMLARAKLYGISEPLTASNTIGTTQLYAGPNADKFQLWLHTTDRKHRFRYEDGRLYELYSVDGDYLRNGNKPLEQAITEWASTSSPWSEDQARAAFVELLKTLELPLDPKAEGSRLVVEPFEIDSGGQTVIPFYTVRLYAEGNMLKAEIHFRSTPTNGWQPTLINTWINDARGNDPSVNDLLARFYREQ